MAVPPGVWGIDVGQCALKALRLQMIDDQLTATAFDYVEHPKILSQPDADPDQLTHEALQKFLSRNSLRGDTVVMSVPGQSGLARFVKLPPVEERKINDIVKFEAKQQIPFPLDEVVWDFQKISAGNVTDGFAMDTEIGLFAMKRDMIARFLSHFQKVDVEVHIIQMAPLALCNFLAYEILRRKPNGEIDRTAPPPEEDDEDIPRNKKRCVVALDLGTDSSNLIISDGEKIIWQRPIPLGGNHFTRALTKEMKLTFAKAEHLKRNAAKSADLAKILKALKPVLTEFVGEVQRSLGYFTNTHRDAVVLYMVGLGSAFRLPGLQKFLSEKLSLDVRKPGNFARLHGESVTAAPVFTENLLSYPVAYGLALQGLELSRLHTNLLPQEIIFDRKVRAKKPWAVATAAALLVGSSALAMGYAQNYRAVLAAPETPIGKSIQEANSAVQAASAKTTECTNKEVDVRKAESEVQSVIAGKYERLNWIRLNEYINRCLPVPGTGGNLTEPRQVPYWNSEVAKRSLDRYRALTAGTAVDARLDDELRRHLPHVDIEAINCLYTERLETFFENAKKETKEQFGHPLQGMRAEDLDAPPKGAGWVVELRGYTFYDGRTSQQKVPQTDKFLIDTLVHNLATRGLNAQTQTPAAAPAPVPGTLPSAASPPPAVKFDDDPIENKISHVFLYGYAPDRRPQSGTFTFINQSYLPGLLTSTNGPSEGTTGPGAIPTPGTPMPRPGTPGAGAQPGTISGAIPGAIPGADTANNDSARDNWQPLDKTTGSSAPSGTQPGFPSGATTPTGPRTIGRPAVGGGGGRGPRTNPMTSLPGTPGKRTDRKPITRPMPMGQPEQPGEQPTSGPVRYEFVVMFIWREPTPSDTLISKDTGTAVPTPSNAAPSTGPGSGRRPPSGPR